MKFNKVNILTAAAAVILVGCATPKPGTPEFVQKKEDEQQKAAVKTVEQTVSKAPAWYTQPPVEGIINSASFTVTNEQNVAGYTLEKSEFFAEGDKYRAYVLIRYPVGENNKVIAAQIKKNALLENKVKASKAWEDLENEIEKAKKK